MSRIHLQKPLPELQTAKSGDWLKPVGSGLALLLFVAGLMKFSAGISAAPGEKTHLDFITGAILLGGAVGIIGMAWGWFDPIPPAVPMPPGVFYGIGAVLTVTIPIFILRCGMHQIGGFDHSALVDVGWRLYHGQKAYADFPYTEPVAFMLGSKFALQWFGVSWRSNVVLTALFAMATFAWSLFLLAQLFGRGRTTLIWAVALQAISLMLVSYWWYNPITAVAAVLYTLSATYWLHRPSAKRALISYGGSLFVMATMKPNVAGVLIPAISLTLFASPCHRWKALWVSLVSFALFLILLSINDVSFIGMLTGYLSVAQRGASLHQFLQDLSPLAKHAAEVALASIVLPVMVALYQGRKSLRRLGPWIPAIALLGGLYGFLTNGEQKLVDLPPVLMAAILLVAELRSQFVLKKGPVFPLPLWWGRYFTLVCIVLGAAGLAQGYARDRIKSIGMPLFFEYDDSKHTLNDGFFKGVHCGNVFDEVLKEVAMVLREEPASSVWFGPRMEWAYAAFDKPSPLHQPVLWDPGVMFAKSDQDLFINNFLRSRQQLLILFKNDVAYYTQDQVQRMTQPYTVDQSFPLLTILRLRKE